MPASLRSIHEQEITDLSQLICSKIQQYTDLVKPDNEHEHSIDSSIHPKISMLPSPISRCPDIILDYIFEYVVEEGSHNVRPLLHVNKRFHQLAMSNPRLWRKIFIKLDKIFQDVNSLTSSYISICLQRSGEALLDVVLDVTGVGSALDLMGQYAIRAIQLSTMDEEDRRDVMEYVANSHCYGNVDFPLYERKMERLLDAIRSFAGPEVQRWRSLFVSCPDSEIVRDRIVAALSIDTSNLQSLQLEGFNTVDLERIGPIQSKITHLVLPSTEYVEIFRLPLKFAHLTKLDFRFVGNELNTVHTLKTLSRCISLRELGIIYYTGWESPGYQLIRLHLPRLTSFHLAGDLPQLIDRVEFDLPQLEFWNFGCAPTENLPVIDAMHVKWDLLEDYYEFYNEMECLVRLLATLKGTETLTVKGLNHPDSCLTELREMKAAKKLPECLKIISLINGGSLDLSTPG
ncbi:hypothetical protein FRC17_008701 [Serendipita sp. 399]|nr:hypothetical protein FRC17_008701 [Serendipita sp. 399]